jgi:hypothetical protein
MGKQGSRCVRIGCRAITVENRPALVPAFLPPLTHFCDDVKNEGQNGKPDESAE